MVVQDKAIQTRGKEEAILVSANFGLNNGHWQHYPDDLFLQDNRIMSRLIENVGAISFHVRWLLMSPQERYAVLWARTKKLNDFGYTCRRAPVVANK